MLSHRACSCVLVVAAAAASALGAECTYPGTPSSTVALNESVTCSVSSAAGGAAITTEVGEFAWQCISDAQWLYTVNSAVGAMTRPSLPRHHWPTACAPF